MASANPANNPKNVGIIMDGNGRWAKQNSLIKLLGKKSIQASLRLKTILLLQNQLSI
jgi:undecaprenyl diphosphate synthase